MTSALADYVVALGSNGRISSRGSVSEALEKDSDLRADVTTVNESNEKEGKVIDPEDNALPKEGDKPSGQLIAKEEIIEGRVGWDACEFPCISLRQSCLTFALASHILLPHIWWRVFLGHCHWRVPSFGTIQHGPGLVSWVLG